MSKAALPLPARTLTRLFVLVLSLSLSGAQTYANFCQTPAQRANPKPIGKAKLLEAVRLAAREKDRKTRAEFMGMVTEQVLAQGLDFQPSADDEQELNSAGASPELLAAVRRKATERAEQLQLQEVREWRVVKLSKNPADFEAFLQKYPQSEFLPLARELAEQLTWDALKESGQASDFETYLTKYPTGKFSAPARERAEQLAWDSLKESAKPADFESYLQKYPNGKFVAMARERLEQLEWEALKESDKLADIEGYLQKYPNGKFAAPARERLEQLEWEALKESERAEDFEAFLKKHPTGKFVAAARQRKERLTAPKPTAQPPEQKPAAQTPEQKPPPATPSQSDDMVLLSTDRLVSQASKKVQPAYPAMAKSMGVRGEVKVRIIISETGKVTSVEAISGNNLLRQAATQAALLWTFRPVEQAGKPVKAQGVLVFNFTR